MSDFSISKGKNTPAVRFMAMTGTLVISGKSYPEDARRFYDEVQGLLQKVKFAKTFTVELDFDYISSSSVVCILDILKGLKTMAPDTTFLVRFFYENGDDDMLSIGENYQKLSGMNVEFLVK